jgi:glycosyltransferase involved in cell wall biosynthesis
MEWKDVAPLNCLCEAEADRMMKILHAPVDIAGQMGVFCRELRKHGLVVNGYNWYRNYFQYQSPLVQSDAYEIGKVLEQVYQFVDIVHFHNGSTLFNDFSDLSITQKLGKKVLMHHWGNDVRDVELVNREQPFKLPPSYHTSEVIRQKLQSLSSYIDTAIIQDYELYRYVSPYYKKIHILPLVVDCSSIPCAFPSKYNNEPLIVHAPTNTAFKGTLYIESALETLQQKFHFNYKRIEKMSHREAMEWYRKADIVIDQVLCGTYGLLSVEAMAMGKPVVAYIREDLRPYFPKELPIFSVNPIELEDLLPVLLKSPTLRHNLGQLGRRFVEQYHDVKIVIPKLIQIYQEL